MADPQGLTYYDAYFEYDLANRSTLTNLKYDKLINCVPTADVSEHYGPWKNLRVSKGKFTGNKPRHGIDKRNGMAPIFDNGGVYFFDDMFIKGEQYVVGYNAENTRGYIYKNIGGSYTDGCQRIQIPGCNAEFCQIASFDTTPCAYKKLSSAVVPMGDRKQVITNAKVTHKIIGNSIVATFTSADGQTLNVSPGDYVYVSKGSQLLQQGQYREVTGLIDGEFSIFGSWLGLYDYVPSISQQGSNTTYNRGQKNPWSEVSETNVTLSVYSKIDKTIVFATDSGISYITNLNCDGAQHYEEIISDVKYPVSSIFNWNSAMGFITNGYVLFGQGGQNIGNFNYSIQLLEEYTRAIPLMNYVILLGPHAVGLTYIVGLDNLGNSIPKVVDITDSFGYFSEYSFQDEHYGGKEEFLLLNSAEEPELLKGSIIPGSDGLGNVKFSIERDPIGNRLIQDDVIDLKRHLGDKVTFSKDASGFIMFINTAKDNDNRYCKVLRYYDKTKEYFRWYFCNLVLYYKSGSLWLGNKIFCNEGDLDDGLEFNQYISATFGDRTPQNSKFIAGIEYELGYESIITPGKTQVLHTFRTDDHGDIPLIDEAFHTTQWIKDISSIQSIPSGKENRLYRQDGRGGGIYYGNGSSINLNEDKLNYRDIAAFCALGNISTIENGLCEKRKYQKEVGCDIVHQNTGTIHNNGYVNSEAQNMSYVGKKGYIFSDLDQVCRSVNIEILATGKNRLQFYGFVLGFMYMDNEDRSGDDVMTLHQKCLPHNPKKIL